MVTARTLVGILLVFSALSGSGTAMALPPQMTPEQREWVEWAQGRFAEAGLALPDVTVVFHDHLRFCGWNRGLFFPGTRVVEICEMLDDVLIHELAHAWANASLNKADRKAFMDRRGLDTWGSKDTPWAERATEQVAIIITWGLMPESQLVRWEEAETGAVDFRLLHMPDSDAETLWEEFTLLTGSEPVHRDPSEWVDNWDERDTWSPELVRMR